MNLDFRKVLRTGRRLEIDVGGVREKREKGERVRFVRETNERQESVRREKGVESERRE